MIDLGTVASEDEAREAIAVEAARFLSAGGVLTWSDWANMPALQRSAFLEAAGRLRVERHAHDRAITLEIEAAIGEARSIASALDAAAKRIGGGIRR